MAAIARHRAADEKVQCRKLELDALTLTEVAGDLRVSVNAVSTWIAKGDFPSVIREVIEGERIGFVRRKEYERWKKGTWPNLRERALRRPGQGLHRPVWSEASLQRWRGRKGGLRTRNRARRGAVVPRSMTTCW
jgi:hypothetical protein